MLFTSNFNVLNLFQLRANALIKRGSMSMQQQNTQGAESDFTLASDIDPENCDVYHHRGQVGRSLASYLITNNISVDL